MPLGFEKVSSNQFFVPKGHMRIAQRFSVGNPSPSDFVPKGRLRQSSASAVPLGLLTFYCLVPNAEALGYSQPSLRDALQILVALAVSAAADAKPRNRVIEAGARLSPRCLSRSRRETLCAPQSEGRHPIHAFCG